MENVLVFQALILLTDQLKNLTRLVEEKGGILANLNPEYKEKYVETAQRHADDLIQRAKQYAEYEYMLYMN